MIEHLAVNLVTNPMIRFAFAIAVALLGIQFATADEAKLRPGDSINLIFREIPTDEASSLSGTYRIDTEGMIKLPYLPRFRVAALSPTACEQGIEKRYISAEIFTRITVTVGMDRGEVPNRTVTVMGEVRTPGTLPFSDSLTPLRLVAAAGGFTDFADPRKSTLVRNDKEQKLDLSNATSANATLKLLPGDLLIIKARWR